jgi:hypothetical protein
MSRGKAPSACRHHTIPEAFCVVDLRLSTATILAAPPSSATCASRTTYERGMVPLQSGSLTVHRTAAVRTTGWGGGNNQGSQTRWTMWMGCRLKSSGFDQGLTQACTETNPSLAGGHAGVVSPGSSSRLRLGRVPSGGFVVFMKVKPVLLEPAEDAMPKEQRER